MKRVIWVVATLIVGSSGLHAAEGQTGTLETALGTLGVSAELPPELSRLADESRGLLAA